MFQSIGNAITSFFQGIVNTIRNFVNTIVGWFQQLFSLGASVSSSFGGTQFHVKGMATGGTLTSGTALVGENGPELLTMVGNKAQITPLTNSQTQSALSSVSGGGDTVVKVNFTGSLSQLARILQPEIQVETARRGVSLVKA